MGKQFLLRAGITCVFVGAWLVIFPLGLLLLDQPFVAEITGRGGIAVMLGGLLGGIIPGLIALTWSRHT